MMCPVECMIFNETAITITSLIKPEVKTKKDCNIWLSENDMSDIFISKAKNKPVICKDGWVLA